MKHKTLILWTVISFAFVAVNALAVTQYQVVDLGTLGGWSTARAVNESLRVTGYSHSGLASYYWAFEWDSGVMQSLPGYEVNNRTAFGINEENQIVGSAVRSGNTHFTIWENGILYEPNIHWGNSHAYDINDLSKVVGFTTTSGEGEPLIYHAFLWQNDTWQDLPTLGGDWGFAYAINNQTQVVGEAQRANGIYAPFLWQNGTLQDLGGDSGKANDINELGQVVGTATISGNENTFLWLPQSAYGLNQGMNYLGQYGEAQAINDNGQIVGGGTTAFLWQGGNAYNLNSLIYNNQGWDLTCAYDITNSGVIVGEGINPEGIMHGFMMVPIIPEPSAIGILMIGFLGLLKSKFRREK